MPHDGLGALSILFEDVYPTDSKSRALQGKFLNQCPARRATYGRDRVSGPLAVGATRGPGAQSMLRRAGHHFSRKVLDMTRRTEVVRRTPSRQIGPRLNEADLKFLPIGLTLVLLPELAWLVENILRFFLWAALSFGGAF